MAFVKTDDAHYKGIASAIRSIHGGTATYTPPEMVDFLTAGGVNIKPWNIPEGLTVMGVKGTMKVPASKEFPSDLPVTEEDFDREVRKTDPTVPVEDKFVLVDNSGNITVGYLCSGENSAWMSCSGIVLPVLPPEWDREKYPYLYISPEKYGSGYQITAFDKKGYYEAAEHRLRRTAPCSWWSCTCDPSKEMVWSDFSEYTHTNTLVDIVSDLSTMIYLNFDVVYGGEVVFSTPAPAPYTGFAFSRYNKNTTEFRAIGWRRVSWHTTGEHAGTFTSDDFTARASGGWNYLKNIRCCSREKLFFGTTEIWPGGEV